MLMRILISLLLITLWTTAAQGRMYRWVDENGVTVYSQSPPQGGESATQIKSPPPPSTGTDDAWKNVDKMLQKSSDLEGERKRKADQKRNEEENIQVKKKNCATAKRNLEVLQGPTRAMIRTPDGEYHRYTEKERRQKIGEAEAQIKKHCT